MDTVTRAKNMCLSPDAEWTVVAEEHTPTGALITSYVIPLAAIGAVAGLIGGSLVGRSVPYLGTYRVPIVSGIIAACFALVMAVVGYSFCRSSSTRSRPRSMVRRTASRHSRWRCIHTRLPGWQASFWCCRC